MNNDTLYELLNCHLSAQLHQTLIQYSQTECNHLHIINYRDRPHLQFHGNMGKKVCGETDQPLTAAAAAAAAAAASI